MPHCTIQLSGKAAPIAPTSHCAPQQNEKKMPSNALLVSRQLQPDAPTPQQEERVATLPLFEQCNNECRRGGCGGDGLPRGGATSRRTMARSRWCLSQNRCRTTNFTSVFSKRFKWVILQRQLRLRQSWRGENKGFTQPIRAVSYKGLIPRHSRRRHPLPHIELLRRLRFEQQKGCIPTALPNFGCLTIQSQISQFNEREEKRCCPSMCVNSETHFLLVLHIP